MVLGVLHGGDELFGFVEEFIVGSAFVTGFVDFAEFLNVGCEGLDGFWVGLSAGSHGEGMGEKEIGLFCLGRARCIYRLRKKQDWDPGMICLAFFLGLHIYIHVAYERALHLSPRSSRARSQLRCLPYFEPYPTS